MKRLLLVVPLVLLLAGPAYAESGAEVAAALRSLPVYQSQGLDLVDVGSLTSELQGTDPQVDVAVLPESAASSGAEATRRAVEIAEALDDDDVVVLVVTANHHLGTAAGDGAESRGVDAGAALKAEQGDLKDFDKEHLTAFVLSFAESIAGQVSTGPGDGAGGLGAGTWLLGALVVAGVGGWLLLRSARRRTVGLDRAEPDVLSSILTDGADDDREDG